MNRRRFLQAILATGIAPAIVRAESLMKIVIPSTKEVAWFNGEIGKYEGVTFIENNNVWAINSFGGYIYSQKLSEELRKAVSPLWLPRK